MWQLMKAPMAQRRLKQVQGELTPLEVMRSMEGPHTAQCDAARVQRLSSESTPQKMQNESAERNVDSRRPK